ncbi:hypothetical protein KY285_013564 [Solanum tuberosum]|nr:hypothetical protein KY285_013564 [Solanum tuberosum]
MEDCKSRKITNQLPINQKSSTEVPLKSTTHKKKIEKNSNSPPSGAFNWYQSLVSQKVCLATGEEKIMAQQIMGALFQEGTSQTRPTYFNGKHFSHWKVRMKTFIKSYDVKVWRVIKVGDIPIPISNTSDEIQSSVTPSLENYTNEQMEIIQINSKAKNVLYNAISGEEYEKISCCDTAKEMWDKLEVTYEGTDKVKETIISLLVYEYELFQMKEGETIEGMFARLSKIIGELKASGKIYPLIEHIRRVLRSLPPQWHAKVVALESMNLNTLTYDEVRGDLIAFEKTHLNKKGQEESKKKTVAFKANQEDKGEEELAEDEIALITSDGFL